MRFISSFGFGATSRAEGDWWRDSAEAASATAAWPVVMPAFSIDLADQGMGVARHQPASAETGGHGGTPGATASTPARAPAEILVQFAPGLGDALRAEALHSTVDRYAGRSTIPGLETFSINASQQQNEVRAVGSAGMRYMIASNQALAFDASVRQMPYGNDPSVTTMLRYSIGF